MEVDLGILRTPGTARHVKAIIDARWEITAAGSTLRTISHADSRRTEELQGRLQALWHVVEFHRQACYNIALRN